MIWNWNVKNCVLRIGITRLSLSLALPRVYCSRSVAPNRTHNRHRFDKRFFVEVQQIWIYPWLLSYVDWLRSQEEHVLHSRIRLPEIIDGTATSTLDVTQTLLCMRSLYWYESSRLKIVRGKSMISKLRLHFKRGEQVKTKGVYRRRHIFLLYTNSITAVSWMPIHRSVSWKSNDQQAYTQTCWKEVFFVALTQASLPCAVQAGITSHAAWEICEEGYCS